LDERHLFKFIEEIKRPNQSETPLPTIPFSSRLSHDSTRQHMKAHLISPRLFAAFTAIFLVACAKEADSPEAAPAEPLISAPTTLPGAAAANAAPDTAVADARAAELTQIVRKYAAERQRAPKDFQEIVAAGYLPSAPAAPAGKKYIIDKNLAVQVADQ
jgi:hypothetical protein